MPTSGALGADTNGDAVPGWASSSLKTLESLKQGSTVTVNGQVVNVRRGPGVNFDIVTMVLKGKKLAVLESKEGWTKVRLDNGNTGWIADWLLAKDDSAPASSPPSASESNSPSSLLIIPPGTFGPEPKPEPTPEPITVNPAASTGPVLSNPRSWKVTIQYSANIRTSPSLQGDIVRTAAVGEVFDLGSVQDGWYQLLNGGKPGGWIASWLTTAQPTATSKPSTQPSRGSTSSTVAAVAGSLAGKTIIVDPGHGYFNTSYNVVDQGASGQGGTKEKDVVLDVSRRLASVLQSKGARVIMTRQSDKDIKGETVGDDLTYRSDLANKAKADLFVSIHNNSNSSSDIGGITTYYFNKEGMPKAGEGTRMRLAGMVQQSLVAALQRQDRSTQGANFAVLRETNMPAILIELMFLSNPEEEKLLNQGSIRQKAAEAIAAGLQRHFEQP
ncbi:N-acetylmuramoyl-L-alanine amidase [Heliobacterium chlorum]|uniref:N-acetylmuramoyl-L-alanine amidase n=1 Tax=Heliobacterium chlorum TaxID=2698 RepID=A0ABR7T0A6_HELCL|nr:N-acetylmuramoyl-L-alanine amidase [Heliobacterium chlorum]MBC9783006.1 N-acetylmuramoyl-L-alanine amidase [Heliobacterium chlorum]